MKIAVFTYNFAHRKTQDFLVRLFLEGIPVSAVIAANPVKLRSRPPGLRTKVRYSNLVHPKDICERMRIPYFARPHDPDSVLEIVRRLSLDTAVVAGARILPKKVIEAFPGGIINLHPGPLPQARGLDALKKTILAGIAPTVTAHYVDEKIDGGRYILHEEASVYADDTLQDLGHRLDELQVEILPRVVRCVSDRQPENFAPIDVSSFPYEPPLGDTRDQELLSVFEKYKDSLSKK